MTYNPIDNKTRLPIIIDLTPKHKDKIAGVHGAGTANIATTSDITTHAALTTGVHGAGTSLVEVTARKGAASGYASLDAGSLVVQNPANATATPTASKIAIADTAGTLDSWVSISPSTMLRTVVTSNFAKTADTALANVTGLALTLAGTSTYVLEAVLFVDATAIGGHKYSLDGTVTASSIKYQVNSISNASNLYTINTRLTALAGTIGQTGATEVYTEIKGTILTNAAGTINCQFAQQVASGTSSVLSQSSFKAVKI